MSGCVFYLGTHKPGWLATSGARLFVSRRTLAQRKRLPRAIAPWALDSGGFTQLQDHGRWTFTPAEYVAEVRRFRDEVGRLEWAAPMDWMCEKIVRAGGVVKARVRGGVIRFAGTGLSVADHQRRTIDNLLELLALAPDLPWAGVFQGDEPSDYLRHVEGYVKRGFDFSAVRVWGVGSVCRRQHSAEAGAIFRALDGLGLGLKLHGFGVKTAGLRRFGQYLASADSMAWSDHAKRRPPLEGHDKPGPGRRTGHKNCANCPEYAARELAKLEAMLADATGDGPLFKREARPPQ